MRKTLTSPGDPGKWHIFVIYAKDAERIVLPEAALDFDGQEDIEWLSRLAGASLPDAVENGTMVEIL